MKFALKLPGLNRNWLMLGGALVLGVVAIGLSNKVLSDKMAELDAKANSKEMVAVVVAKAPLPRGAVLDKSLLAVRSIPAQYAHAGSIQPNRIDQFLGQKLAAPLQPGEALLEAYVDPPNTAFSTTLANGNRALTTEVDEVNSISGMLRPGDHIDLMATARSNSTAAKGEVTFPLLSNVEVLATGQVTRKTNDGDGEEERTYTTITLSVSPRDAQRVVVAKTSGKLTAVLRNPEDGDPTPIPALTIDDVVPKQRAVHRPAVQYIIGGQS